MARSEYKVGYEIDRNRHLWNHPSPRPPEVVDAELKETEEEVMRLLRGVTE